MQDPVLWALGAEHRAPPTSPSFQTCYSVNGLYFNLKSILWGQEVPEKAVRGYGANLHKARGP